MVKRLARAMQQGAQGAANGQMDEAMAGLSQAGDQLSELEQLEQEMNQLDTTLADLQNARDDLDQGCSKCKGNEPGPRGGMGPFGRGKGGLAPEQQTPVDFKVERAKVKTGKGAIIGQFLVDGEQIKGEVSSGLAEVVAAGEREASDRINRHRIPW